jgi:hypothetical protein
MKPIAAIAQAITVLSLIVTKLAFDVDISWWIVTLPIWAPLALILAIYALVAVFGLVLIAGVLIAVTILERSTK